MARVPIAPTNRRDRCGFEPLGLSAWSGNFRDLNAAVTRMGTLAAGGRITAEIVKDEIERLRQSWSSESDDCDDVLRDLFDAPEIAALDLFDQVQLSEVVRVCRRSRSLSEAGRALFAVSRTKKGSSNDADRLKKYLARFGLSWAKVGGQF